MRRLDETSVAWPVSCHSPDTPKHRDNCSRKDSEKTHEAIKLVGAFQERAVESPYAKADAGYQEAADGNFATSPVDSPTQLPNTTLKEKRRGKQHSSASITSPWASRWRIRV